MGSIHPPNPMTSPITHIVLFKYVPSIPWTVLQAHFDTFLALPSKCLKPAGTGKPYLKSLRAGKNISWQTFNKSMTHGFVIEFETQEDLDFYHLEDPVHLAFSTAAKPLIEDSVVVDIQDGFLFGASPKKPASTYKGSCHCGSVEWTAKLGTAGHILCHCDTCKKLGGGAFSLNQIIGKDDLRVMKGELRTYTYQGASGKDVKCYFCGTCTSHVYHHQDIMGDQIIVRTILLDGGDEMSATGEIFPEGKLKWVADMTASLST